jgi:large subunit ribosomal protein L25
MSFQKIEASIRQRNGKGPARRLRNKGLVPAVLYGKGIETTRLSVNPRILVKALAGPKRINTLLEINVEGAEHSYNALVRDHQFDPVTRQLLHVDFLAVSLEQKIKIDVPVRLEGRAVGQQLGGTLSQKMRKVKVECRPEDIPEAIVVDITNLGLGKMMTGADLDMPENVSLLLAPKSPVVEIVAKRADSGAAGEGEAAGEGGGAAAETA